MSGRNAADSVMIAGARRAGLGTALCGLLALASAWPWTEGLGQDGAPVSAPATNRAATVRPAEWAQAIERPGLPNFFKVSDTLYRGAQPTAEGLKELVRLGIKTDVSLRSFHSDDDIVRGTGLAYEHIDMKAWHAEEEDVLRFLSIVANTNKTPVFVHCQHGADRTGTMCAIYRMVVQGWTRERAIKEMMEGGFGFHQVWTNLIKFIQEFDVDSIKKKAGIKR